jgi:hypothetical protein
MQHPIRPIANKRAAVNRDTSVPPQWPSYTGTSQFVGTSPSGRVTVYVDPTLGGPALQNAQDLVNDADRAVSANDAQIFGAAGGRLALSFSRLGVRPTGPAVPTMPGIGPNSAARAYRKG